MSQLPFGRGRQLFAAMPPRKRFCGDYSTPALINPLTLHLSLRLYGAKTADQSALYSAFQFHLFSEKTFLYFARITEEEPL